MSRYAICAALVSRHAFLDAYFLNAFLMPCDLKRLYSVAPNRCITEFIAVIGATPYFYFLDNTLFLFAKNIVGTASAKYRVTNLFFS